MLTDVPTDVHLPILLHAGNQGSVHCDTTLTGQQVLARQATSAHFVVLMLVLCFRPFARDLEIALAALSCVHSVPGTRE